MSYGPYLNSMPEDKCEPKGCKFLDKASNREMMLISEGSFKNWLAYKHPDGQWVTLRESTEADRAAITPGNKRF